MKYRKNATFAVSIAALAGTLTGMTAPAALAQTVEVSVWGGVFQFESGEVDVPDLTDQALGFQLGIPVGRAESSYGNIFLTAEQSVSPLVDNDQTVRYQEIAYGHTWETGTNTATMLFGGYGQSIDNGDDGSPIPYAYVGGNFARDVNGTRVRFQIGALTSNDYWGETIQSAVFGGIKADFSLGTNLTGSLGAAGLSGIRWNSTTPNNNTISIAELSLGLAYANPDQSISYWVELLRSDYNAEGETDDPWVNEIRFGLTYAVGGGATGRGDLPNAGRWVSVSANEIE